MRTPFVKTLGWILPLLMIGSWSWAETQVTGEVDAGYQKRDVSANESKFETYGETPDGAVIPSVKVDVNTASDTIHFEGQNLRQNNQSYDLNYNRNYKFKVDASWDQIPHDYSNVAQTLYNEPSPGLFLLPDQIQTNMTGSVIGSSTTNTKLSSYWDAAHNANLQTLDNKGAITLGFRAGEHAKFDLGISEDRIEGHKPWGATLGLSQPVQLPSPVDWKIYNMRSGAQYNEKNVQFGINYLMSAFKNDVETMVWDNPLRLTDTAGAAGAGFPSQGRLNLAPDNWSHTVTTNAGFNLPARTRFTATGSMGYMRQNQDLLPLTSNTKITAPTGGFPAGLTTANLATAAALPEQSANATMITWTQDYALTNRVVKPVTFGVRYHSNQLVNRTSQATFPGFSPYDASFEVENDGNGHFEFRKDLVEGSMDYQIVDALSLGVKYGTEWDTRNDREVRNTTEKTLTVTSDFKPAKWTSLRGSYVHAHRRPQDYDVNGLFHDDGVTPSEMIGLRRYDVADRLRNQGKVLWQLTPGSVSIGIHGSLTHDNFQPGIGDLTGGIGTVTLTTATVGSATPYSVTQQNQMYGLLENRDAAAGVDIDFDVSERLTFTLYYDYEETKALQRSNDNSVGVPQGSPTGTAPLIIQDAGTDWTVQQLDKYHMAGVAANIGRKADKVSFKLGYDIVESRGATEFLTAAIVPNPITAPGGIALVTPPDTKYMKQDITGRTNLRVSEHVTLVLGYLYEKFDVSDWQQQNIPLVGGTTGNQTNIFLGANLQNYVAHVGSIVMKYKF